MHASVACAAAAIENAVPYAASRSSLRRGVVKMRSNVPETRSRCIVIDVIKNITMSGNTPSMIRHALLNGGGVPGRWGAFWNMKYISVMIRLGTTRIIATLR